MDLKSKLASSLSLDRLHLLHLVADVAGAFGFPIYIVGGSVRDLLLGCEFNDFDLTVEGDAGKLAEAILKKLGGKILVHSKFKTARWTLTESTLNRLGVPLVQPEEFPAYLDFVSARSETYVSPGALPQVKMSTIDDDLRRRDFTINAMAVRLDGINFGLLLDPLNGHRDLERKLIRFLHPKSFVDDPTRMLRAVRYAMRYGFELESETREALFDTAARAVLSQLSGERLRNEFDLIFEEEKPLLTLDYLNEEADLSTQIHSAFAHADAMALSNMQEPKEQFGEFATPEILSLRQTLGWVLYLKHFTEADIDSVAKRLAFPALLTKTIQAAALLESNLTSFKNWKPSQWTFYLDELPSLAVYAVWLTSPEQDALREYLTQWQKLKPFTSGDDLKARGLEPGPKFKEILNRLRTAWLDGEVGTEEEERSLLQGMLSA